MAKTATTALSYSLSGDSFGGSGPLYSLSVQNLSGLPPGSFTLANGFNSIPIPAAALGVVLVPPPTSAITKTLKGVTGDTGILIDPANPTWLKFTAGQNATLGIAASGAETLTLLWV